MYSFSVMSYANNLEGVSWYQRYSNASLANITGECVACYCPVSMIFTGALISILH